MHSCRLIGCKNIKCQSWRFIKNLPVQPALGAAALFETGRVGNFLCDLQLWPQILWQPLDLQECTIPHLKDLIHICLEFEAQDLCMSFNRFYVGSKYPYHIIQRQMAISFLPQVYVWFFSFSDFSFLLYPHELHYILVLPVIYLYLRMFVTLNNHRTILYGLCLAGKIHHWILHSSRWVC